MKNSQKKKKKEKVVKIKEECVPSTSSDTEPTSSSDENDDICIRGNSPPYSYLSAIESVTVKADESGTPDSDSSSDQSENQQKHARSI